MKYGLIGETLAHSFSKTVHEQLAGYAYELISLPPGELAGFMRRREFAGVNVSVPYGQSALALCDEVDARAREMGAVDTVLNREGRLVGCNTGCEALRLFLRANEVQLRDKTLLILGSGGAAKAVAWLAREEGAQRVLVASRRTGAQCVSYAEAGRDKAVQVVINATPLGMYPHNGQKPLVNLRDWPELEAVVELVHDPLKTQLLLQAERLGLKAVGGLGLLVAQAKSTAELFTGTKILDAQVKNVQRSLLRKWLNVVLIGMPGSGKSSLGRVLAKRMGRELVDLDKLAVKEKGMSIEQMFAQEGERAFRDLESKILAEVSQRHAQVISTGGGVIKRRANVDILRENGLVVFLDCPVERLSVGKGRPLSKTREDLQRLCAERMPLYRAAADVVVEYSPDFAENIGRIGLAFEREVARMVQAGL